MMIAALTREGVRHAYKSATFKRIHNIAHKLLLNVLNNFLAMHKINSNLNMLLCQIQADAGVDGTLDVFRQSINSNHHRAFA